MKLAYVCSQSKSNSDVDGAVVESQVAAGQWKCVQPVSVETDSSRALSVALLRLLIPVCFSTAVTALSHVDCLVAAGSVGQSVA